MIRDIVATHSDALRNAREPTSMQDLDANALIGEHDIRINELIDHCFHALAIDDSTRHALRDILAASIKSYQKSSRYSGLVFAGFGEDEIFPSLVEVVTDGAIGDTVKAYTKKSVDLARAGIDASINAFAQHEMVGLFMNGVDAHFFQYLTDYLRQLLTNMTRELMEANVTGAPADSQLSAIQAVVQTKLNDFQQAARTFCQEQFIGPVVEIVRHLPKEELANMAEALVSLTSLKRRVSKEEETVGGPVDVAVISKGDGLIWIKRKHYFDPALNRDYLVRQSPDDYTPQEAKSEIQTAQT